MKREPSFGLPEHAVEALRGVLARWPCVRRAVLYGSRAKGNPRPGSDIDLTLEGDLALAELMAIETEIDDLLLPWMVDLSRREDIDNPQLQAHIDRVGITFYEKTPDT